ncbi:MAG: hypothetical protein Q9162_007246 [Coniocarpon cinnabarinum]
MIKSERKEYLNPIKELLEIGFWIDDMVGTGLELVFVGHEVHTWMNLAHSPNDVARLRAGEAKITVCAFFHCLSKPPAALEEPPPHSPLGVTRYDETDVTSLLTTLKKLGIGHLFQAVNENIDLLYESTRSAVRVLFSFGYAIMHTGSLRTRCMTQLETYADTEPTEPIESDQALQRYTGHSVLPTVVTGQPLSVEGSEGGVHLLVYGLDRMITAKVPIDTLTSHTHTCREIEMLGGMILVVQVFAKTCQKEEAMDIFIPWVRDWNKLLIPFADVKRWAFVQHGNEK